MCIKSHLFLYIQTRTQLYLYLLPAPGIWVVLLKWVGGGALRLLRTDLFELRDAWSGTWSNASATLTGPTSLRVVATANAARECDAARYAWWDNPCPPPNDHPGMPANATAVTNCSLYDVTGQPAPPFKINFR